MKKLFLSMVVFVFATTSYGADVSVSANSYVLSCSYYSNVSSDILVEYKNKVMNPSAKVELIYGFNGIKNGDEVVEWVNEKILLPTERRGNSMQFEFSTVLTSRGNPLVLRNLVFVIKITDPSGWVDWDKGSATYLGFYEVKLFDENGSLPCVSADTRPAKRALPVDIIERN